MLSVAAGSAVFLCAECGGRSVFFYAQDAVEEWARAVSVCLFCGGVQMLVLSAGGGGAVFGVGDGWSALGCLASG